MKNQQIMSNNKKSVVLTLIGITVMILLYFNESYSVLDNSGIFRIGGDSVFLHYGSCQQNTRF